MGPMANARRIDAMDSFVADAKHRGGNVVTGGARRGNQGYFYEPTVVTEVPDDSKVMTQEPFGPIAPIVTFKTFDEVVERANSLPYGLAAYAFTSSNAKCGERCASSRTSASRSGNVSWTSWTFWKSNAAPENAAILQLFNPIVDFGTKNLDIL